MHNTGAAITVTATTVTMMIDERRREKVRIVHYNVIYNRCVRGNEIGGNK